MYSNASASTRNNLPSPLMTITPNVSSANGTQNDSFGKVLESSMNESNRSKAQTEPNRQPDTAVGRTQQSREGQPPGNTERSAQKTRSDDASQTSTSNDKQSSTTQSAEKSEDATAQAANTPADDAVDAAKLAVAAVVIAANNVSTAEPVDTDAESESATPGRAIAPVIAVTEANAGSKTNATTDEPARGQGLSSAATPPGAASISSGKQLSHSAQAVTTQTVQTATQSLESDLPQAGTSGSRQEQASTSLQSLVSPFATPGSRTEGASVTTMQVSTQVGQRAWADDVANRVMWLAGRGEERAELILTPPSLGKLGVSIQMNGDQATAHFVTASNAAREAVEQAMPRLREALLQAGISMGDSSVSTSSQQQPRDETDSGRNGSGQRAGNDEYGMLSNVGDQATAARFVQVSNGLVDIFA